MTSVNGKTYRFYLQKHLSPTAYNLSLYLEARGWRLSTLEQADFSEAHLGFNDDAALCLEYKHLLAALVAEACPQVMPVTYCIDDHNWLEVLSRLAEDFYRKDAYICSQLDNLAWILKPALLNNGQSIQIFQNLNQLAQHFAQPHRLGGQHVLQQYISNPHLLRDYRKYSIRHFLVLTNFAGAFLYPYGYFNVAMHPYAANNVMDLKSHLTNEHLYGHEPNVIQIPTARFDLHASLYPQIKKILIELVSALQRRFPDAFGFETRRLFALFGVDFMVDANGRVWLLEVNHGPCFPITDEHPLQSHLYKDFWQAIIDYFVLPVANNETVDVTITSVFDKISVVA